ncbi:MAG: hypothetical protein JW981_11160 [Anaerolineae bacterium]|nr:hypothetical protein [Anaerolineae bacterium]
MNQVNLIGLYVLAVALLIAAIDWGIVFKSWKKADYAFKPLTQATIIFGAWLLTQGTHDSWQATFFIPGFVFSLIGDVFLLFSSIKGCFVSGMVAFLLAHICYILGLSPTLPPALPVLALLVILGMSVTPLYRRLFAAIQRGDHKNLVIPIGVYGAVLFFMVVAAWSTLFRPAWISLRRGLVIAGASLFFASDMILSWNRFVSSSKLLRVLVRVTYHSAQVLLAASIAIPG